MVKKFIRKDINKKKRLHAVWRRPKGITNKMRLSRAGHAPSVRAGYGTKDSDRGKNKEGLMIISVATLDQLRKINPKTEAALLAGVGKKRKMELMAEATKLKITLVNFNAKLYAEKAEKFMAEKKKESASKKAEVKKEAELEAEVKKAKKSEDKKESEEALSQEDIKKAEKEEKDRVLIKK